MDNRSILLGIRYNMVSLLFFFTEFEKRYFIHGKWNVYKITEKESISIFPICVCGYIINPQGTAVNLNLMRSFHTVSIRNHATRIFLFSLIFHTIASHLIFCFTLFPVIFLLSHPNPVFVSFLTPSS